MLGLTLSHKTACDCVSVFCHHIAKILNYHIIALFHCPWLKGTVYYFYHLNAPLRFLFLLYSQHEMLNLKRLVNMGVELCESVLCGTS